MKTRSFLAGLLMLACLTCLPWSSYATTVVVTTLADGGAGSLRQAIADAQLGDTITFATNGVITLTHGELLITKDLTIAGPGPTNLAIDAGGISRVLEVSNANVTLDGLTLINGKLSAQDTNESGGGIHVDSKATLVLNDSTLSDNVVLNGNGGGIGVDSNATLVLNDSTLSVNTAGNGNGGGIDINSGSVVAMTNSTISGNSATFLGGGIFSDGTLTLNKCTIAENVAPDSVYDSGGGGGIFSDGTLTIDYTTLTNNEASPLGEGGGIDNDTGGAVTIANSILHGNGAMEGGGIANAGRKASITNCTLSGNGATFGGGCIYNSGTLAVIHSVCYANEANLYSTTVGGGGGGILNTGTLTVNNDTLSRNFAYSPDNGGGLENQSGGVVTISNSILYGNYAGNGFGGGVDNNSGGTVTIANSTLSGNFAYSGGGLSNKGSNTLNRCTVTENSTAGASYGGGILNEGTLSLANSTVSSNVNSGGYGGGIYNRDTLSVVNSTLSGNSSPTGGSTFYGYGGGIYCVGSTNVFNNSTISGNYADYGGGIVNFGNAILRLTNTIVAGNSASTVIDSYPNILGSFFGANNLTNGIPLLAPLGNYGGPTQTMPPLAGSPAIDAGRNSVTRFLSTDQRGFPRRFGAHVDIGAVELQGVIASHPPLLMNPMPQAGGSLTFSFTNIAGAEFTVLTSTNLALPLSQWSNIGLATQSSPGLYQFTDLGATNSPQRFYQVVSP